MFPIKICLYVHAGGCVHFELDYRDYSRETLLSCSLCDGFQLLSALHVLDFNETFVLNGHRYRNIHIAYAFVNICVIE